MAVVEYSALVNRLRGSVGGCSFTGSIASSDPKDDENGPNSTTMVASLPLASTDQCPNGGVVLQHGIDENGNGLLDADEVDGELIVCHGTNNSGCSIATDSGSVLLTCSDGSEGDLLPNCDDGDLVIRLQGKWTCKPYDACAVLNGGCDPLVECQTIGATPVCGDCPAGYSGDGTVGCVDINECMVDNGGCHPLSQCSNTAGSRTCGSCPGGYQGDGIGSEGCADINECLDNNGGCDPLTACQNEIGSRLCGDCPNGYSGDGESGCTVSKLITLASAVFPTPINSLAVPEPDLPELQVEVYGLDEFLGVGIPTPLSTTTLDPNDPNASMPGTDIQNVDSRLVVGLYGADGDWPLTATIVTDPNELAGVSAGDELTGNPAFATAKSGAKICTDLAGLDFEETVADRGLIIGNVLDAGAMEGVQNAQVSGLLTGQAVLYPNESGTGAVSSTGLEGLFCIIPAPNSSGLAAFSAAFSADSSSGSFSSELLFAKPGVVNYGRIFLQ